jgi:hypothetical protein
VRHHVAVHLAERVGERHELLRQGRAELPQLRGKRLAPLVVEPPGGGARAHEEPRQAVGIEELVDQRGDRGVLAEEIELPEPPLQGGLGAGPGGGERALLGDAAQGGEEGGGGRVGLGAEEPVDRARPRGEAGGEVGAEAEEGAEGGAIVGEEGRLELGRERLEGGPVEGVEGEEGPGLAIARGGGFGGSPPIVIARAWAAPSRPKRSASSIAE